MKKIVLTGGPGAGKTTLAEVIGRSYAHSVVVVPEAATLLFSGGFPRWDELAARQSVQRAIYYVQRELEASYASKYPDKVLVLDRGTLDGAVYWPGGPDTFYPAIGSSREAELSRYDAVIYLDCADQDAYKLNLSKNPHRKETWEEAGKLDQMNLAEWSRHPNFIRIRNQRNFRQKVLEVLSAVASASSFPDS